MSEPPDKDPQWMNDLEDMANASLPDGSACEQVHPIVERWFNRLLDEEPPRSRPAVEQAMSCLTTEVLHTLPEEALDAIFEALGEDEFVAWVEQLLLIGRCFETSLHSGELDDL